MTAVVLLKNSNHCRLCGEENSNGIDLYDRKDDCDDLCALINKYLPIKVEDGDSFPKTICPGCHIQLEATKLFMDLIVDGQGKLRSLLKAEQELLFREEKERQRLEQALQNHNPNASVETYTIRTDEDGEKYIIQIYSDGPLFSSDHQLALKAEGLGKPKRKRGRPPKIISNTNDDKSFKHPVTEVSEPVEPVISPTPTDEPGTRQKRKIRPPARYQGDVHGKELEKIFKTETVIKEDNSEDEKSSLGNQGAVETQDDPPNTLIGKMIVAEGEEQEEQLIFIKKKPGSKIKRKAAPKAKFSCEICKKEFQHFGRCKMHQKSHKVTYGCQGENCTTQDENKDIIIDHQKLTGHEGICTFEHISKVNGTVILPDLTETPTLQTIADDVASQEKQLKCDECDKTFTCKQNYDVHVKAIHNGEKPFVCSICKKSFAYACTLKNHMIVHALRETTPWAESYNCDVCDKIFQHPSSLMYHKSTEHGNRTFICNLCNKSFKHRQLLLRHQMVHSNEKPFKCEECNRHFKSKTNLVNHENIHTRSKKYFCPLCGNHFLHKTSLWVHMKWHEGSKPHKCDVCKKSFTQKGNLIEHQRIHTGEKPFTCSLCGRSFTTSSQCKLHMKRHTGEKPFSCKFCHKNFLHKETYEAHIRRHLDERPFKCKFCSKAFPEQWACTRHERIHSSVKKYKCDVCNKSFSDVSNFRKHKKIHYRKNLTPNTINNKTESVGNDPIQAVVPEMEIELIPPTSDLMNTSKDIPADDPSDIQIHNLLDQDGNAISITTADGQRIPIVASGNDKLQGFLPDGTIVSFDILSEEREKFQEESNEITSNPTMNLINTEIQFLEDTSVSNVSENLNGEKQAFLSEDGKVCFITAFDENSFLTIN